MQRALWRTATTTFLRMRMPLAFLPPFSCLGLAASALCFAAALTAVFFLTAASRCRSKACCFRRVFWLFFFDICDRMSR